MLKGEGLIEKDLSIGKIMSLVDYKTGGFDPFLLISKYKLLHVKTYHHLRAFSYGNKKFLRKYNENLEDKYPLDGRTFMAIYRK